MYLTQYVQDLHAETLIKAVRTKLEVQLPGFKICSKATVIKIVWY